MILGVLSFGILPFGVLSFGGHIIRSTGRHLDQGPVRPTSL